MPKVTGISNAMPADGPMPGRWLIIVPMNTPMSVYRRCMGVAATASPWRMPYMLSMMRAPQKGRKPVGIGTPRSWENKRSKTTVTPSAIARFVLRRLRLK